ncbi:MAG: TIGR00296 family protein [Promethearchaeota archaeon]
MKYNLEDGEKLLQKKKKNIEHFLTKQKKFDVPNDLKEKFSDKGGAFVTLNTHSNKLGNPLRGCIGYILPVFPLWETVHKVSISAAVDDPRFSSVKLDEMDDITIEISILSVPEKIVVSDPQEYLKKIVVGRDGLIISRGAHRGLLLPQVPVEHNRNWDILTFLQQTCQKAWLGADAWKDLEETIVESFTATIFEETSPRGPIREKAIGE